MSYPKEILQEARRAFNDLHEKALERGLQQRQRIAQKLPQAIALERDISTTSARLIQAVLSRGEVENQVEEIRRYNEEKTAALHLLLTQNGFAEDALEPQFHCKKCRDSGILSDHVCSCIRALQKRLMYERLSTQSPIGQVNFENFSLDWYDATPQAAFGGSSYRGAMERVFLKCQEYARHLGTGENLLLRGDPGLGKTHLSLAIAGEGIEAGMDVLYTPFHTLLSRLEAARFGKSEEGYQQFLTPVLECDLLILDDLGSEFASPFGSAALYDIVNSRLASQKSTIISTNLQGDELTKRYGERITSRLYGCYEIALCMGADIRIQKNRRGH